MLLPDLPVIVANLCSGRGAGMHPPEHVHMLRNLPTMPAPRGTQRAGSEAQVEHGLERLQRQVTACTRCPRLVAWRRRAAAAPRRPRHPGSYWSRPVPGFGDPRARIVIVGLAPGAHGSNRTGRMFTGDASGTWLFRALHKAGLSERAQSLHRDDGLRLRHAWITAAVRCAPPGNLPTPAERDACAPFLQRELQLLLTAGARVLVALGGFAWDQSLRTLAELGYALPRPRPCFAHRREVRLQSATRQLHLIGCYHPSRQNTQTGRLSETMFDAAWRQALRAAKLPAPTGT